MDENVGRISQSLEKITKPKNHNSSIIKKSSISTPNDAKNKNQYVSLAGAKFKKTNSIETLQKDIEYQKILSFKLRESQL